MNVEIKPWYLGLGGLVIGLLICLKVHDSPLQAVSTLFISTALGLIIGYLAVYVDKKSKS